MTNVGGVATTGAEVSVVRLGDVRAQFLAQLYSVPLTQADVCIILAGEDYEPRIVTGYTLFFRQAAQALLLSGGVSDGERAIDAAKMQKRLIGRSVSKDALLLEPDSQNTHEQAVNCIAQMRDYGWKTAHLVASNYHLPRAFLSFVNEADKERIIPIGAVAPWSGKPAGSERTRAELWTVEMAKIDEYEKLGHVATYSRGIEYLTDLEGK